jgi:SNF2 family DNA or RNA helicase
MQITDFHAAYYAYLLTRHNYENTIATLAATLQDSHVDLNPHQIEAALFALQSPYNQGIIEADEVGLGKTIVAGIVIAQKWAEEKQRILVIVPANLRRQWQFELEEKFNLPTVIVDGSKATTRNNSSNNPFLTDHIVITSYNFAHAKADLIRRIDWDMCVIDEAHKLRNVYKPDNIIARSIRDSLLIFTANAALRKRLRTVSPLCVKALHRRLTWK